MLIDGDLQPMAPPRGRDALCLLLLAEAAFELDGSAEDHARDGAATQQLDLREARWGGGGDAARQFPEPF